MQRLRGQGSADLTGGKSLWWAGHAEALRWEGEGGFEEGGVRVVRGRGGEVRPEEVTGARLGGALLGLSLGEGLAASLASGLQLSTPEAGPAPEATCPSLLMHPVTDRGGCRSPGVPPVWANSDGPFWLRGSLLDPPCGLGPPPAQPSPPPRYFH